MKTSIADGDRNRPSALPARKNDEASLQAKLMDQMVRAAVASGIPPEAVAEKVLQAILHDRFWILTHPRTKGMVERRMRDILEDREPSLES